MNEFTDERVAKAAVHVNDVDTKARGAEFLRIIEKVTTGAEPARTELEELALLRADHDWSEKELAEKIGEARRNVERRDRRREHATKRQADLDAMRPEEDIRSDLNAVEEELAAARAALATVEGRKAALGAELQARQVAVGAIREDLNAATSAEADVRAMVRVPAFIS